MNCANHPEVPASAFCRDCGKPVCAECQRPALGSVYCAEHVPAASSAPPPLPQFAASPYSAPAPGPICDSSAHPVLALMLGFIPGVGALYNGQYAKGLIHAVVFGLLVSMASNTHSGTLEPLFGIMIAAWVFYMAFEAYHTARKRRQGDAVDEFSSLFEVRPSHNRFPAGAILLIGLGFILLLDTTDMIDMVQLERFWPVGLIVFGLYLLYARVTGDRPNHNGNNAEARR
jgi:hypothetical protein